MPDETQPKSHVTCSGSVTVRQRPSLLLMKMTLQAEESTLELGLANVKKQCEAASQWLQRLNAIKIDFGEPHFAIPFDGDPMRQVKLMSARSMAHLAHKSTTPEPKREVNVILTALWNIAGMSAEETLVFLDRLQFETTTDSTSTEPVAEPTVFTSPEEQVREMMARMAQLTDAPMEARKPQFMFIAQLSSERKQQAIQEAIAKARHNAEQIAFGLGMRLSSLAYLHHNNGMSGSRANQMMERQRCDSMLASTSFMPGEYDIVSEDPRSAEFNIGVSVCYNLE